MKRTSMIALYSLLTYAALGLLLTIATVLLGSFTHTYRATGVFLERPLAAHVGTRWENRWSTVIRPTTVRGIIDPYLEAGVPVVDTDDSDAWQRSTEELIAAGGFHLVFRKSSGWPLRCSSFLGLAYKEENGLRVGHSGWEVGSPADPLIQTIVLPNGDTRTYEPASVPQHVLPSQILWPALAVDVLCFAVLGACLHGLFRLGRCALRRKRGRCPACGYSLTGIDGVCPECGKKP